MTDFSKSVDARLRDPRLDFFRGLAMFFIFISHVPRNPWAQWIPSRFGFSDAAEIFVFCSGMASAFAFGRIFQTRGWGVGTARTLYRAWQIYWVHVALFIALAATLAGIDAYGQFGDNHLARLNLELFYANPKEALPGLLTLTYVPNYFDILPMYFVILLLLPIVMAVRGLSVWAVIVLTIGMWLGAQSGVFAFPAEPWSEREWFFNPFGWQLVFFTGFALVSGWIPAPPVRGWLIAIAAVLLLVTIPFANFAIIRSFDFARAGFEFLRPLMGKTDLGILRYVHFLTLAYLAWALAGPGGARLRTDGVLSPVVAAIYKVGQQALATFVTGMFLARVLPVIYEVFGRNALTVTLVNLTGFAALIATAYGVAWFKGERSAKRPPRSAARNDGGEGTFVPAEPARRSVAVLRPSGRAARASVRTGLTPAE